MSLKHAHKHRSVKIAKKAHVFREPWTVPLASQLALKQAMKVEGVDDKEYNDLLWIMAQESGGEVDSRNPASSARGLYQLLRPQYSLNPNGERSFGNAVEEAQGGIRYIMGRYGTARKAKTHWLVNLWY